MNGKQDVLFRFAAAPKGVETVREPLSFMRRGADAHGAYPDSLAISQNWSVAAQGSDVPVYAVPVTRCGPHSFCRVELLAEGCAAALRLKFSGMLHEVRITPQTDALQWRKEGGDIICKLAAPCTFTVEVNGRMYTPLTVFVEASEQNIPRREDPNVLWFGPGLHRVSSLELHTGQTLYLASGAVLKAVQPGKEEAPTVAGDWAGVPNYKDFIRAQDSEDIKVLGRGIVDLSELEWHARRTLCFTRCRRVTVDGPVLLGAAHWTAAFSAVRMSR